MLIEGKTLAGGSLTLPQATDGTLFTQSRHAGYQQAVLAGNVFCVGDSAGGQGPAGLSASPISVALYNPATSGINAVILFVSVTSIVAPAAAQVVWLAVNTNTVAAASTGTALAAKNCLVGSGRSSAIRPLTTATLPAAPVVALVLGACSTGAVTTQMVVPAVGGWIDGAIVLGPGSSASVQFSTQSGAAGNMVSWIWEEVAA